ncbi:MAG: plasmid pRiA4b ORF-3 family protein [Planctomycetia bacterium]|nr:plasmid pRiA4b ORF-3 family protein [Planctomycetia bacterium]
MAKKPYFSNKLSPRSQLILDLFEKLGSIDAILAAHPDITEADIDTCDREAMAMLQAGVPTILPGRAATSRRKKSGGRSSVGGAYQLKITLRGSKPSIWRRVVVPADITLDDLHSVIQRAMGWNNSHLHAFEIDGTTYSGAGPDGYLELDMNDQDESDVSLGAVAREKMKFSYTYDFGDDWIHIITVEKFIPREAAPKTIICTGGKMCCPMEDSGGLWGYYEKLGILADKNHPEYEEIAEWIDKDFDPEAFDVNAVNKRLKAIIL